jgi:hypothetical protein
MRAGAFAVALLLTLSASLFLLDLERVAANQDGDFIYLIDGDPLSAIVTGYVGPDGDIAIPATLGGFPTTTIGTAAFRYSQITSVTMPDTVTLIGQYAFAECGSLTTVVIPNSVTHIAQFGFLSCPALSSLTLGDHLTIIGYNSFSNCTSLTSLVIPDSVTGIGDEAFGYCTALTTVVIGDGVYSIGNAAFSSCTSLYSVTIGDGVAIMGYYAFANCRALTEIVIPNSVESFGNGAFSYCTSLTSVTMGARVTAIGEGAFGYCVALTSMSFHGNVAPIMVGDYWLTRTNADLRGHALTRSDFPAPGGDFHGLTMGVVVPAPPGIPLSLSAEPGDARIIISWSAPADDGGQAITAYKVYRATSWSGTYSPIGSSTSLDYLDANISNGQSAWYKVTAENPTGEGDMAGPSSTTAGTPTAPRDLSTSGGVAKVTLSWRAPISDSGSAITSYRVYRVLAGVPFLLSTQAPGSLSYVDSNGSIGVSYGYYVQAVNSYGPGVATAQSYASSVDGGANSAVLFGVLMVVAIVVLLIAVLRLRKRRAARAREAARIRDSSKADPKKTSRRSGQKLDAKQTRRKK